MQDSLQKAMRELFGNALRTSYTLFKIIIPVSIVTRLLQELDLIDFLGVMLAPVMEIVGLPGQMGLVWATTMFTNMYAGMVVFVSLAPGLDITVAQVTVLGTMILVAHSLPIELLIAQKAGARLRTILVIRVLGALLLGWLLNVTYSLTNTLQQVKRSLWNPPAVDPGWGAWVVSELRNLFLIFLIIFALMALMMVLKKTGVIDLITRFLGPVLNLLGISRQAAPITVIGMTLGIGYGGGLIINEARTGNLSRRDLFASVALMSLCHSLFEDTMLMVLIGGHLSGLLWARLLFALLSIFLLVKLIDKMPDKILDRYLFRPIVEGKNLNNAGKEKQKV